MNRWNRSGQSQAVTSLWRFIRPRCHCSAPSGTEEEEGEVSTVYLTEHNLLKCVSVCATFAWPVKHNCAARQDIHLQFGRKWPLSWASGLLDDSSTGQECVSSCLQAQPINTCQSQPNASADSNVTAKREQDGEEENKTTYSEGWQQAIGPNSSVLKDAGRLHSAGEQRDVGSSINRHTHV